MRKISSSLLFTLGALLVSGMPTIMDAQGSVGAVDRGKSAFGSNCGFCHGSQATGTEQAPNLLRSPLVRSDVNGTALTAKLTSPALEIVVVATL